MAVAMAVAYCYVDKKCQYVDFFINVFFALTLINHMT